MSRIVLQQSVVLSPVKLSTVRLFLSTEMLSKRLLSYSSSLLLGLLPLAEVIAEAHSAVLLVLPLSCRLCRRAKLCTKTPFARDSAALQPVLSAQPLDLLPSYKNPSHFSLTWSAVILSNGMCVVISVFQVTFGRRGTSGAMSARTIEK